MESRADLDSAGGAAVAPEHREALSRLADALRESAGGELLSLIAFGGRVVGDPFYREGPVRSVAVFANVELDALARLAAGGDRLGRRNLSAPLIMTPAYIAASRDAFPLELIEISQTRRVFTGFDAFAELSFERRDVRLQSERELKGELIQLRQGLLASGGRPAPLHEVCLASAERVLRVARGLVWLSGASAPPHARELVAACAAATGRRLDSLARLSGVADDLGLPGFKSYYGEIAELAAHVDVLSA